jgi:cell division initiation protein
MTLTPVEIRHLKPARSMVGGYRRTAVDALLDEIVASFEDVWRERADLHDKVEQLEGDLIRFRELEGLLRTTLISAERAAVTLKEQARKEADLIVEEARAEARAITRTARGDHDRLLTEVRRLKSLLHSALALVDEEPPAGNPEAEAA